MSSAVVQEQAVRTQSSNNKRRISNFSTNSQRKSKHERSGRKRSKSFSSAVGKIKNFKPVLPTKFLLGGNINDPLNLNSLQDEEINKAMNAVTPKSSPIPTPPRRRGQIEVIIPPNIHDPLNLIDCADEAEYEQQLCSPVKKGRKKRMRKRRTTSGNMDTSDVDTTGGSEARTPEVSKDSAKIPDENANNSEAKPKELTLELSPKKDKNNKRKSEEHKDVLKKFKHSMDKIVSPVVPQPGAWLKRTNSRTKEKPHRPNLPKDKDIEMPPFREKNKQFQYGNYNRYYGYRNPQNEIDPRLKCFSHHQYLFEGKDILDIGCNIGHITLSIARDFRARSVTGIDIDKNLIAIARKNIKHYVISDSPREERPQSDTPQSEVKKGRKKSTGSEFYPISMPILYGPIDIPGFNKEETLGRGFPNNVTFVQGNYVLEDDTLLSAEQPQFDVILCLSITKWLHLNWGDTGIKQAFRRMYAQLRPGGKLILEPQNWASYKNKKKLTETIYRNYMSIEFFPEKFTQYLLSAEVGFAKSEVLAFPHHHSKGFQRPIIAYTKSTMFPSERVESSLPSGDCARQVYVPVASLNSARELPDSCDFSPMLNNVEMSNNEVNNIDITNVKANNIGQRNVEQNCDNVGATSSASTYENEIRVVSNSVHSLREQVDDNMTGVDDNTAKVDDNITGTDTTLGVAASIPEVDANILGPDANIRGVDANIQEIDDLSKEILFSPSERTNSERSVEIDDVATPTVNGLECSSSSYVNGLSSAANEASQSPKDNT